MLLLSGDDLEVLSLSTAPPHLLRRVEGGGQDLWLAIPWVPVQRAPEAIAAAESALVRQDSALVADSSGTEERATIWLQVSSSQNPDWAKYLAEQLRVAGHAATVWKPEPPDESYRVVVGPYTTRDAADEAGRRLGRPYFVVVRPPSER